MFIFAEKSTQANHYVVPDPQSAIFKNFLSWECHPILITPIFALQKPSYAMLDEIKNPSNTSLPLLALCADPFAVFVLWEDDTRRSRACASLLLDAPAAGLRARWRLGSILINLHI